MRDRLECSGQAYTPGSLTGSQRRAGRDGRTGEADSINLVARNHFGVGKRGSTGPERKATTSANGRTRIHRGDHVLALAGRKEASEIPLGVTRLVPCSSSSLGKDWRVMIMCLNPKWRPQHFLFPNGPSAAHRWTLPVTLASRQQPKPLLEGLHASCRQNSVEACTL